MPKLQARLQQFQRLRQVRPASAVLRTQSSPKPLGTDLTAAVSLLQIPVAFHGAGASKFATEHLLRQCLHAHLSVRLGKFQELGALQAVGHNIRHQLLLKLFGGTHGFHEAFALL
jgi:hypothetical protein